MLSSIPLLVVMPAQLIIKSGKVLFRNESILLFVRSCNNIFPSLIPIELGEIFFLELNINSKSLEILLESNQIKIEDIVIRGDVDVPYVGGFKDKIKAILATLIQRLANNLSLGTNMYVWGKKL